MKKKNKRKDNSRNKNGRKVAIKCNRYRKRQIRTKLKDFDCPLKEAKNSVGY